MQYQGRGRARKQFAVARLARGHGHLGGYLVGHIAANAAVALKDAPLIKMRLTAQTHKVRLAAFIAAFGDQAGKWFARLQLRTVRIHLFSGETELHNIPRCFAHPVRQGQERPLPGFLGHVGVAVGSVLFPVPIHGNSQHGTKPLLTAASIQQHLLNRMVQHQASTKTRSQPPQYGEQTQQDGDVGPVGRTNDQTVQFSQVQTQHQRNGGHSQAPCHSRATHSSHATQKQPRVGQTGCVYAFTQEHRQGTQHHQGGDCGTADGQAQIHRGGSPRREQQQQHQNTTSARAGPKRRVIHWQGRSGIDDGTAGSTGRADCKQQAQTQAIHLLQCSMVNSGARWRVQNSGSLKCKAIVFQRSSRSATGQGQETTLREQYHRQ